MSERFHLAAAADIPPGTAKEVLAGDRILAIFNVEGEFHALDGICPHAGGPLGEGSLNGSIVTCPWHGWQFDVTTGQHCLNRNLSHSHFPVTEEEGELYVELG